MIRLTRSVFFNDGESYAKKAWNVLVLVTEERTNICFVLCRFTHRIDEVVKSVHSQLTNWLKWSDNLLPDGNLFHESTFENVDPGNIDIIHKKRTSGYLFVQDEAAYTKRKNEHHHNLKIYGRAYRWNEALEEEFWKTVHPAKCFVERRENCDVRSRATEDTFQGEAKLFIIR